MNNALIGYTGFIGQNLMKQMNFDYFYNSKNITEIQDKEFDLVVSAGNSSTRWLVNKNPEEDFNNILSFIDKIKTIKAKKFVLMSTIDVYQKPFDVNEDFIIEDTNENKYGQNRYFLEKAIKEIFSSYLIIRLPIMYGHGLKKNIIYDALNNNEIDKINGSAIVQIYNVKNLKKDLERFIKSEHKIINLATEPISTKKLFKEVFNIELKVTNNFFKYDIHTKHRSLSNEQGYLYNQKEIINDLKKFKVEYESKRI